MSNDKMKHLVIHRKGVIYSLFNVMDKEEGRFYDFLWDSMSLLSEMRIISIEEIKYCLEIQNEIMFFWDEPGGMSWGMDISDVFKSGFNKLFDNLNFLPQDLYIFDRTLRWTIIQSHEKQNDKGDNWVLFDPCKILYR